MADQADQLEARTASYQAGFPPLLAGVAVAAWIALVAWGLSPHAGLLGHEAAGSAWVSAPLFLVGWLVMVAAMMLPTTTSLVESFGAVARQRDDGRLLLLQVMLGFGLVWLAVGAIFRAGDLVVHRLVESSAWLEERPELVGAALLAAAGLYELSSLKNRCLSRCRTPRGLIIRRWGASTPSADSRGIGVAYGWSCVGCCWALMLLMFGLGAANPAWMLILGGVMAVEKNTAVSRRLSTVVGAALLVAAALVALEVVRTTNSVS